MSSPITTARAVIVPALRDWDSTLIFAHGLGDTGEGFSFLSQNWRRRSLFPTTAFIFPHAPKRPITGNMGMSMPGWYDIYEFSSNLNSRHDETGMLQSQQLLNTIITEQLSHGIPSKRILIGGFSQGAVMSLLVGLTSEISLGGIIALSSYCPFHTRFANMISDSNRKTPVFMGHGTADPLVLYEWGKATRDILIKAKCNVTFKSYEDLTHSVDPDEMEDMEKFITERLAANPPEKAGGAGNKGTDDIVSTL